MENGCLKGPDQSKFENGRLASLSKQEWEVNGIQIKIVEV